MNDESDAALGGERALSVTDAGAQTPRPVFPLVRTPQLAQILDLQRQIEADAVLPSAAQQARLASQVRYLIGHAKRHSAFWRDRLGSQTDASGSARRLVDIPVLDRATLQRDGAAMRIGLAGGRNAIRTMRSSGSTGVPVEVSRYLPIERPLYAAILRTDLKWQATDRTGVTAIIKDVPERARADEPLSGETGRTERVATRNMVRHSPQELLEWLVRVTPTNLVTTPSMVGELARLAIAAGTRLPIAQVRTFAEPVTPELRRVVRDAFGSKLIDRYTSEEFGWIALQCPRHEHLHVMTSNVFLEVVDDQGKPCGSGEAGRVLVTGLHSYAMPLIRYELGDIAEFGGPCDCGITLPVLKRVYGRERSFIRMPDGTRRLARLTGEYWRAIAPVVEYRVVQYPDASIEAFIRAERRLGPDELDRLRGMLARVLEFPGEVRISQVGAMIWPSRWKRVDVLRVDVPRQQAIEAGLVPAPDIS